ncbi:tRNA (adenosine(37)-N6)-dimethylallyltransferase MiaA [Pelagibius sp. CAU 1746]|uniref:tRNA (adenosine(37)-N6)-dimethylallyltransferase MiaA n=1 Tax=Pelagibius sp. CAU 1746 TaxID=3140370 RepID=UPI00325B5CBF
MPDDEQKPLVMMIAGPTASGKSALAAAVAAEWGGTVINADSMQIYKELSILTARPGGAELRAAPHRLYGVLSGAEACSVGRWREMALSEVESALAAGRLPILVGGTGLYLKAFAEGLNAVPKVPAPVRAAARADLAEMGKAAFHARLAERDPVMGVRLEPGDSQRLLRAWEVLTATGRSLAEWQAAPAQPAPYRFARLCLLPPRPALYATCDARLAAMIASGPSGGGALEEVAALVALNLDPALPVMKAVGVPEFAAYLAGDLSLEAALARAQQATRRYAKRQMTWLRHQFLGNDPTVHVIETQYSESLMAETFSKIRQNLLTDPG